MTAPDDIAAARAAAAADGRNAPALARLAEQLLHAGETDRAAQLAREAAAHGVGIADAQFLAAAILGIAGDLPAALAAAQAAAELAPDRPTVLEQYGALLLRAERPTTALSVLATLVEIEPDRASHWRMLADALHGGGIGVRAISAMRRAIALSPADVEYRLHLAALLGAVGRFGDALTELAAADRIAPPDPRISRMQSAFWVVLGESGKAWATAEAAVAGDPDHAEYREHLLSLGGAGPRPSNTSRSPSPWAAPRFEPSPHPLPRSTGGVWSALALQVRILSALLQRETHTRFSHTKIGYLWAVIEPISHLLTLGAVFRLFNNAPPPVGDDLFVFYVTGLVPFLVFWHISQDLTSSLAAGTFLLQLPVVRPLDVALTRSILYFITQIGSTVVVFSIGALLGFEVLPYNFLDVMAAMFALWGVATGVGLINIVIATFLRSWETFFAALNRLLYFASGIYYSPIRLPVEVREILIFNPVLQGVEWFRAGFFNRYDPPWVDRTYLVLWALTSLFLGLAAFRVFRKRLVAAA